MLLGVRRNNAVLTNGFDALVLRESDALIAVTRSGELPGAIANAVELSEPNYSKPNSKQGVLRLHAYD